MSINLKLESANGAYEALAQYRRGVQDSLKHYAVEDLLYDLRHYCDVTGISFKECLARANKSYKYAVREAKKAERATNSDDTPK